MFKIEESLSLDDLLIKPKFSTINSRSEVDVSVNIGEFIFSNPCIPANMKTVCGLEMAEAVVKNKGLAILHRFLPIEEQLKIAKYMVKDLNACNHFAISLGVKEEDYDNVDKFIRLGIKIFCIDIAHGDSQMCLNMIDYLKSDLRKNNINNFVIAGNVATGEGAKRLWMAGADAVKIGVGSSGICTTRINTGNGVAQMSALMEAAIAKNEVLQYLDRDLYMISDGGCKLPGDVVKCLCLADMVMLGNMFAGCEESPGDLYTDINGKQYKSYVGSSTYKSSYIEGIEAMVSIKGKYLEVLTKILEGVRSGMSYQNARNLQELRIDPTFVKISSAGIKESGVHDVYLK